MIKKKLTVFLMAIMIITILPMTALAAGFSDMPNNWSTEALQNAVSNGLLQGFDGKIMPDANLTRAEMAAVINRAFGATEKASLNGYSDVPAGEWYYDDMAKALQMGTFTGNGGKLAPESSITRQEAFLALARAFKLSDGSATALDGFKDKELVDSWAIGAVSALKSAGYLNGANSMLNPLADITRAEFAHIMDSMLKFYIKSKGTYTNIPSGNVMINAPDVTLKDVNIAGDLIIGDGVGDGDVTLDNVTVAGRTVIRGGGVNSVKIVGTSSLKDIIVARIDGQVRVYAQDGTEVGQVTIDGKDDVIIEGNVGSVTITASDVTVSAANARIGPAVIKGKNVQIVVASGSSVNMLTVDGPKATVEVAGSITNVVANSEGTEVKGSGNVGNVAANADNVAVTTPNTVVTAATGTTGVTAGTQSIAGGNSGNTSAGNTGNTSAGNTGGNSGGGDYNDSHSSISAPTISTLSPTAGTVLGGTTVTITGTNFTGATAVSFGGTAAASFTVDSAIQITAVTPEHEAGAAQVVATTAAGSSAEAVNFTYVIEPDVVSLNPAKGPLSGGTSVTITGTRFTGATAVSFGGTAAASFTVNSSTQITAVTPAHTAGAAQVVVTTAGGPSVDVVNFNYVEAPAVYWISPSEGIFTGGTQVIIMGIGFTGATSVTFDEIAVSFSVDSDEQITATAPAHATGDVLVTVTTAGGPSDPIIYTYDAVPRISDISAANGYYTHSGPTAGGTTVTITGVGFEGATAVTFGGAAATSFTVDSATQITAVTPAHGAGVVTVVVTTAGGSSGDLNEYQYVTPPTVASVTPAQGPASGGTEVTITGTGFLGGIISSEYEYTGALTLFFGGTETICEVISDTQITAYTPQHDAGAAQAVVMTAGGPSADAVTFAYIAAPAVYTVSPAAGPLAGGTEVTITGARFTGATGVSFGSTAATSYTVDSDTQITAFVPMRAAGAVQVVVTIPVSGSSTDSVYYTYALAPTVTSISTYDNTTKGSTAGGTGVIITGTGFIGVTAVTFAGAPATSVTVQSDTRLTAVTPAHGVGTAQVVVAAAGGTSTDPVSYTYMTPVTVLSLSPNTGTYDGGTTVIITGTAFTGATSVTFSGMPALSYTVDSDTQITAVTPEGRFAVGYVNVVVYAPIGWRSNDDVLYHCIGISVSPATGSAAGGETVTLSIICGDSVGFTGATAVTFGGTPAASYTVDSDTQITAVAPAGSGTVDVVVAVPGGNIAACRYTYN